MRNWNQETFWLFFSIICATIKLIKYLRFSLWWLCSFTSVSENFNGFRFCHRWWWRETGSVLRLLTLCEWLSYWSEVRKQRIIFFVCSLHDFVFNVCLRVFMGLINIINIRWLKTVFYCDFIPVNKYISSYLLQFTIISVFLLSDFISFVMELFDWPHSST